MRHFSITIDIAAPASRVWEVMSDAERWHEWTPSVTGITIIGGGPIRIGSRAWIRQPKFPPAMWKVTALEPGRRFVWVSGVPGLLWVTANHSVEPAGGGSRATLSLELRGILGSLFGRMTKEITERYLGFEASGLKARSETPSFRRAG